MLMPMKAIPRDLPENYDVSDETALSKCMSKGTIRELERKELQTRSNRDDANLSENEKARIEEETKPEMKTSIWKQAWGEICSVQFVSLCTWYCLVSLRINSFQAWFNNSLQWWFPNAEEVHSELTNIFGLTYIMSLPISPGAGVVVDTFANYYRKKEENEIKGRTMGVAVVCGFCSIASTVLSVLCTVRHSFSVSVIAQVTFSVIRTFIYAILAQAAFLLFPMNLFGLLYGTLQLCNGLVTLLADPIFRYIQTRLDGNYAPVHYALAVACIITIFQPFVLVFYKKR